MSARLALAIMLIACSVVAFVAWFRGGKQQHPGGGPSPVTGESIAIPGTWPRTVLSGDGTLIELESAPRRVVAATARALEFASDLIAPEHIAAIPEQALEYGALDVREAEFVSHPRFATYTAETVLVFEPDFVLADTWQQAQTHQRLREAGVPVLVLGDVATWAQARAALELVGHALGADVRAQDLIAEYELRVNRLQLDKADPEPILALAYSNFGAEGFTCGQDTSLSEMMRLAGLVNVAEKSGLKGHASISYEQLLQFNPELILVSRPIRARKSSSGERGGAAAELLYGEQSLSTLRAIKSRSIITLPASMYASASHRLVAGAEVLAAQVALWRAERLRLVPAVEQP